jgi:hypothetical protein
VAVVLTVDQPIGEDNIFVVIQGDDIEFLDAGDLLQSPSTGHRWRVSALAFLPAHAHAAGKRGARLQALDATRPLVDGEMLWQLTNPGDSAV